MTSQLDIFGGDTALQKPDVTERQQYALDEIAAADGGLASDELGAVMHERRGAHDRGVRCTWCVEEGKGIAGELRRKGLVVRKRSGMWQLTRPLDTDGAILAGGGPSVSSGGDSSDPGQVTREAAARLTDPATSHQAAASVRDLTGKQQAVLECFRRHGPMTDEQLVDQYRLRSNYAATPEWPTQTDSGLRTRRHELVERGLLRDSGRRGTTDAGRATTIWELSDGIPF